MIVAIYARFSSVADLEKTSSIEAQIEMCKRKAVENGWVVDENHINVFLLHLGHGFSGTGRLDDGPFGSELANNFTQCQPSESTVVCNQNGSHLCLLRRCGSLATLVYLVTDWSESRRCALSKWGLTSREVRTLPSNPENEAPQTAETVVCALPRLERLSFEWLRLREEHVLDVHLLTLSACVLVRGALWSVWMPMVEIRHLGTPSQSSLLNTLWVLLFCR